MSDLILLAPHEHRCRPANGCAVKARCARALASGTPVADLSESEGGGTALCAAFLLPLDARRQAGEFFAKQAKDRLAASVERARAQQLQQRRERMERDDG